MFGKLTDKQRSRLRRISVALMLFVMAMLTPFESLFDGPTALGVEFVAFLVPYLIAGYDVLLRAGRNIADGKVFDENFLMSIATIGAFALALLPGTEAHFAEGAAVMLFYQVGEWFEDFAVDRSRRSIADMMDIAPDIAHVRRDGETEDVDPEEVAVGEEVLVKPGERIPIDGVVVEGSSQLDTSALTGESVPRVVEEGAEVYSGSINLVGPLVVRTVKAFEESTVSRILELVEDATDNKARTENFITRFARYYTPIVVFGALAIAVLPP
ncbi:MAG: heavy metal translocating P-type ATPase, partial [Coriobacteriia bacterium]|nr:heavy metal translocating P-type ATPase [Coriobacteriia bacterium]